MMKTEIHELQRLQAHYRVMLDMCTDSIKQLAGYTPDSFKFTFSIKDKPIVSFDIAEQEGQFCISFFMSWHQFYRKKLTEITSEIDIVAQGAPLGN